MNPKIMKRPMFRMGGPARVNYNTGTSLKEIENLIAKRARLRDESLDAKTSLLPLQILAGQPGLSSIRGIGDLVSILSGIGTNPETFGALAKLKGVELEKTKAKCESDFFIWRNTLPSGSNQRWNDSTNSCTKKTWVHKTFIASRKHKNYSSSRWL